MLTRKIYDKFLDWKKTSSRECALLIDGARRVGKSYIASTEGSDPSVEAALPLVLLPT